MISYHFEKTFRLKKRAPSRFIFSLVFFVCLLYQLALPDSSFPQTAAPTSADPLSVPQNLDAQVEGQSVNLSWQSPTDGSFIGSNSYHIYRSSQSWGPFALIGSVSPGGSGAGVTFTYQDNPGLGVSCYEVLAYNGQSESGPSGI